MRDFPQWQSHRWQSWATVAVAVMFMLLVVGASVAQAATALTAGSTGVTATEATVWGFLDPGGYETSYHFEYGTTTSYGSSTDPYTRSGMEPNPSGRRYRA